MNKLFTEQIYDIIQYESGFIFVYCKGQVEDKMVVSYRSVSVDDGVVNNRTRADYEYIKYGEHYKKLDFSSGNFITYNAVKLDDGRLFLVAQNGEAKIIDNEGYTEWQGSIRYKDCGPAAIAHYGHTLWASFSEKNALIRFNLRTMREELRIGGSADSSFMGPEGLWVNEPAGKLIVCNSKAQNILEVDMKTYSVHERAVFDEPVHRYLSIGKREFVVLDSGLYLL